MSTPSTSILPPPSSTTLGTPLEKVIGFERSQIQPEECLNQRALARSCPSDDANLSTRPTSASVHEPEANSSHLFSWFHLEAEVLQNEW